jgi:hypothetical protein
VSAAAVPRAILNSVDRQAEATPLAKTFAWWQTIAWFKDGDLEAALPADVKERLTRAAAQYDPGTGPAPKLSARLN